MEVTTTEHPENEGALPASSQEETERAATTSDLSRAAANHEPMTGSHSHAHPAFGSQGDDASHEHTHPHENDNNHQHSHDAVEKGAQADILRTMPAETSIYAPITRIDTSRREVVVRATAEDLDSFQTVIGFDGSKDAFQRWRGNIREMHDPTKAVGKAIRWDPFEEEKAIDITLRVSKGAEDTWQKVLDGTLSGASIGARNAKWGKRTFKGKEVPFLERYDLVEVSLVDNPSCPGCDIKIVRSQGSEMLATDVLDFTEEPAPVAAQPAPAPTPVQQPAIERIGARVSADTRIALHKARDHSLQGAQSAMQSCNCEECESALNALDFDNDGDIDIVPSLDTDGDAASGNGDGTGIMKAMKAEISRHLAPTVQRMNGIAARFATLDTQSSSLSPEIVRQLDTLEQKISRLDEVHALLSTVIGLVERIAAQPQAGGPIVNSAVMRNQTPAQPFDDTLGQEARIVEQLSRAGVLNKNQQIDAVLYLERRRQNMQQQAGR